MSESQIPEDLRRFILTSFPSVPHLEALLTLRRDPQTAWNVQVVAQRLYTDEKSAATVLDELVAARLVTCQPTTAVYRYAPATPAQSQMVDRLADLYSRALVAVTNLIHGRSAQMFADAFKFRKD